MRNIFLGFSKTRIIFPLFGLIISGFLLGINSGFFPLTSNKLFAQTKEENAMAIDQKAQTPNFLESKPSVQDLIKAVSKGNTTLVKSLIEKGVNLNERDEKGGTPLMYAAFNNQQDAAILKLLLRNGAEINARDVSGATALMMSMAPGGSRQGVKVLLEHNADVNIATLDGQTPLMWASTWWDVDIIRNLLEKGAEINAQKDDGTTVLHIAAKFYRSKTVKLLLESGADPLLKTKAGKTPLMLARERFLKEKQSMNKFVKSQLTTVIKDIESAESKKK